LTPERFRRYDQALEREGFDGFLSASPADAHYLTGAEDGGGFLAYRPGRPPLLVLREDWVACARDSARGAEIRPFTLFDDPAEAVADALRLLDARRVALGSEGVIGGLAGRLGAVELVERARLGHDLRRVKEPDEIAAMRRGAACLDAAFAALFEAVRPGATDREAAAAAVSAARIAGADAITFIQVKAGPRAAYPHAVARGRPFERDEIGFADIGAVHGAYRADYARAFTIGDPPDEARRIVETVDRVEREVVRLVEPGLAFAELYRRAGAMLAEAGYPDGLPHHLGHTIGLDGDVASLIVPTSRDAFIEGEVVCVEPAVYVASVGGARIEDMLLVGSSGNEVLSRAERVGRCG
jgi:Xaa-Pro aminopeptidase